MIPPNQICNVANQSMESEAFYTINRALLWSKWLACPNRSLEHKRQLVLLLRMTIPQEFAWFYKLISLLTIMRICGNHYAPRKV